MISRAERRARGPENTRMPIETPVRSLRQSPAAEAGLFSEFNSMKTTPPRRASEGLI
jgi:hypothetical protein